MTWIVNAIVTTAIFSTLSQGRASISLRSVAFKPLRRIPRALILDNYRLPDNVIPNSYEIKIVPDMDGKKFAFHGETKINISVKKRTKEITLHAKYLDVSDSIQLQCHLEENPSEIFISNITNQSIDDVTDFLTIVLAEELSAGSECNLTLSFKSTTKSSTDSVGFVETSPSSEDGKTSRMVVAHFQLTHARQAFPCWDEPALKANFIISIEHDRKYVAHSNMHMEREEAVYANSSRVTTYFAKTPKISTYLVTFAVGDMVKAIENDSGNFTVWARKDVSSKGKYAQKIGTRILKLLENYMNFTYEMQGFRKMDLVIAHNTKPSDAMANWGLMTGGESEFLLKENFSSAIEEHDLLKTLVYKLSHQWFGNLVSVSWWDDLWVEKGFAVYLIPIIIDQIKPSWRKKEWFVIEIMQKLAFNNDDTITGIHAVNDKWYRPGRDVLFEAENFNKAACLIRMISNVLGEETFQNRLRHFLITHAFKSFTSDDFLTELSGGNEELLEFMKNWVTLPGFPVVTVTRNYEKETATINQSRYLEDNKTSTEKYWIPLNYVTEDNLDFNDTKVTHWLRPTESSTEITCLNKDKFVIFNKQQFGYYRVNYDETNWRMIAKYLRTTNFNGIHAINRAQLINDALNLAKVGQLKYDVALNLTEYLKEETDFVVWSAVWNSIEDTETYLRGTEFSKPLQNHLLNLSRKIFKKLLLNEDGPIFRPYENQFLFRICTLGSDLCPTKRAQRIFIKWLADLKKNPNVAELPEWISCSIGRDDDYEKLNKMWESYLHQKKHVILGAISCSSNTTYLEELLTKAYAKRKSIPYGFGIFLHMFAVVVPDGGIDVLLDFIIKNYEQLEATGDYTRNELRTMLVHVAKELNNRHQLNKIMKFSDVLKASIGPEINYIFEEVRNRIENFEERSDEFRAFFSKNSTDIPASQYTLNVGEKTVDLNIILLISSVFLLMVMSLPS